MAVAPVTPAMLQDSIVAMFRQEWAWAGMSGLCEPLPVSVRRLIADTGAMLAE